MIAAASTAAETGKSVGNTVYNVGSAAGQKAAETGSYMYEKGSEKM